MPKLGLQATSVLLEFQRARSIGAYDYADNIYDANPDLQFAFIDVMEGETHAYGLNGLEPVCQ